MRARRIRVARGIAAAAVATFFAAFSHVVSGAEVPGLFALVAASVLSIFLCIALAGRTLSTWRLTASVLLSQLGYHLLFALVPASTGSVVTAPGHHADMVMMTTDATTHVHASTSPAMWLGHALAAMITVAALVYGERLLFSLFDTLRLGVRVLLVGIRLAPVRRPAMPNADWLPVLGANQRVLLSAMRHRGPPVAARRTALSFA
ncbi:hypothetical protein [Mycetocola zhadangensis]|uniref:Uncharacterized protein n=1 Tax=Mycetocola zhadangensis TaxID=1164595 RepID=A0A3L7J505_9MICO|nr:hypothetical protein [Mycetocola zhadangensis]RLQ84551.1 hypothetical protein D9V28_10305 [Mycetocola zhadangensis]GGE91953.1 hypothetical protein GCM10011313_13590 [Mycetocola zhadangensis]